MFFNKGKEEVSCEKCKALVLKKDAVIVTVYFGKYSQTNSLYYCRSEECKPHYEKVHCYPGSSFTYPAGGLFSEGKSFRRYYKTVECDENGKVLKSNDKI